MKKFFATVFALTCTAAHAASVDMQIQMIDSEIARLTIEKQQKYAELDKCAKSVNGFKIAGISLLGLTGVGIAVNISQAVKLDRLGDQINDERDRIAAAKTPVQTDITVVGPLRITEVVREIVADTDAVVAAIINNPDISAADKEVARAKAREITEIAASVPVSGSTDALETAQDEFDAIVTGAAMATGKPDVVASVEH
ncbi:MAG: hypothetical protein LBR41_01430, partial [Rickettsiales bacterium]|nr:hypothetical protein [Rickettsiales bacterium]